jgi:4-hydroxybenzoate polyprenyltransferase
VQALVVRDERLGGIGARAELVKVPLLIVTLASMLGPAYLSTRSVPGSVLAPLVVIAVTGSIGLSILDHVLDREVDRYSHPQRSIPSGRVSVVEAMVLVVALTVITLASASYLGARSLLAVLAVGTIFVLASSPLRKLFPTSLLTNIAGTVALLIPYLAVQPGMDAAIWLLLALNFIWDVGNDTLADLKDVDGDERSGEIVTLPIVLGRRRAIQLVEATVLAVVSLGFAVGHLADLGLLYHGALVGAAAVYMGSLRKLQRYDIEPFEAFHVSLGFKVIALSSIVLTQVLPGG